jgi:hypothetical protein
MPTLEQKTTEVIYTDYYNEFGDQLVVFPGFADFGMPGWFVGYETNDPRRAKRKHSIFFFEKKESAVDGIDFVAEFKDFKKKKR